LTWAGEGLPALEAAVRGWDECFVNIVELPEQEFLYQVEARDFKHLERRRVRLSPGKPAVASVAIQLLGGRHMYLKVQIMDVPRTEAVCRGYALFWSCRVCRSDWTTAALGFVKPHQCSEIYRATPALREVPADAWSSGRRRRG